MTTQKKGLIIKKEWLDLILEGSKTMEIRSSNTKIRGEIYLIESGSGLILGTCEIVDSICLDNETKLKDAMKSGCIPEGISLVSYYKRPHGWKIKKAKRLDSPIPYIHPKGAVIWVNLDLI